jgi:hypothetical protein
LLIYPVNVISKLTLEVELDWNLSKNKSKTKNKYTGQIVYNANQSKINELKDIVFYLSKSNSMEGKFIFQSKTWVFITVYKKSNRGDVSNFVDGIADAIKKAIGIDDCYFSFVLDYVVDKNEKIVITILQENDKGETTEQ